MYFSNHFHKAFLNLSGAIRQTGASSDLIAGQLGFADAKTWDLVSVANADVANHPLVVLCQGSLYQNDKIGKFHGGYMESVKSRPINGRLITKFTKFVPRDEKPHAVQIGYNGNVDCACPEFEKDKTYYLRVEVKGSPVLRTYTRNLYRTFGVYTGCPSADCPDLTCSQTADPKKVFEAFAAQIVEDPEIAQFLKEVKVVTQGTTSVTGSTVRTYRGSVCDEGNIRAIAEVLAHFPKAKLVDRQGNTSTYEIKTVDDAVAPDDLDGGELSCGDLVWSLYNISYKVQKVICLTLPLKSDGSSNLSDVQTAFADNDKIVEGSIVLGDGNCTTTTTTTSSTTSTSTSTTTTTTEAGTSYVGCTETIQATILSDNEVDLVCEGVDSAVFSMPQSFNGYMWEECPCCTVADDTDQCVGLRLVAKKSTEITDQFSNCSFDPMDHVETEPITIIVSFVNMFGEACSFKSLPVTEIQQPVIPEGLGEFALRELLLSASYQQDWFTGDQRMREVLSFPYLDAIDRKAKYVIYTITHTIPTGIGPSGTIGQDRFLYKIFVEQGVNASTFEGWMNAYLTSAGTGVALETL